MRWRRYTLSWNCLPNCFELGARSWEALRDTHRKLPVLLCRRCRLPKCFVCWLVLAATTDVLSCGTRLLVLIVMPLTVFDHRSMDTHPHRKGMFGDIALGLYLVRGDALVLMGELDEKLEETPALKRVSADEIIEAQQEATAEERQDAKLDWLFQDLS